MPDGDVGPLWRRRAAARARRTPRTDVGNQRHPARRRDAGAADYLHDYRAAARLGGAGEPARQPRQAGRYRGAGPGAVSSKGDDTLYNGEEEIGAAEQIGREAGRGGGGEDG